MLEKIHGTERGKTGEAFTVMRRLAERRLSPLFLPPVRQHYCMGYYFTIVPLVEAEGGRNLGVNLLEMGEGTRRNS